MKLRYEVRPCPNLCCQVVWRLKEGRCDTVERRYTSLVVADVVCRMLNCYSEQEAR
jgi:hypothetical protein